MKKSICLGVLVMVSCGLVACSSTEASSGAGGSGAGGSGGGGASTSSGTTTGPETVTDVRGDRYCEILIGNLKGTKVHIEVYNTYGLNDCPQSEWDAIDAEDLEAEEDADVVILNGPRYWVMDAFENSSLVDTTVRELGGIEMRLAGTLDLPLSGAMGGEEAYSPRTVLRTTSWVYDAGKPVYELVDPKGRIFDMQSYSVQNVEQTEESLAKLGDVLALPQGWTFQSRTPESKLTVTAVDGVATIVQDDLGNTYQLSQQ